MDKKVRILLVDDDETIRILVTLALENAGYRVETAENGIGLLNRVMTGQYDLVITDITMPGGPSGLDFLQELHGSGQVKPVIVHSSDVAYPGEETVPARVQRLGGVFVPKPDKAGTDFSPLITIVADIVAKLPKSSTCSLRPTL